MKNKYPHIHYDKEKEVNGYHLRALNDTLDYLFQSSAFYKTKLKGFKKGRKWIRSLTEMEALPLTTKSDFQNSPSSFSCVDERKFRDFSSTAGTSSAPVTIALTEKDLRRLAINEAKSFEIAGQKRGDRIQIMTTLDRQFMGGLAYTLGAFKKGLGVIRTGNTIPPLQWQSIIENKPQCIVAVPSFIIKLLKYARENGIDPKLTSVKSAICIGENIRDKSFKLNVLGKAICDNWNIKLHSSYASSEMGSSFTECLHGMGGHTPQELIYCEILDEMGKPVNKESYGELVVTPLHIEGMPLFRFKTGDICRFHYETCSCGRNSPRISPILGRKNQMIKYKGTSLFPDAVFQVLNEFPQIKNYQVVASTGDMGTDQLTVILGISGKEEMVLHEIINRFRARLRVTPELEIMPADLLDKRIYPSDNRKPILFLDKRIMPILIVSDAKLTIS